MDFSEFVGFIITLLAILFLFLGNSQNKGKMKKEFSAEEEHYFQKPSQPHAKFPSASHSNNNLSETRSSNDRFYDFLKSIEERVEEKVEERVQSLQKQSQKAKSLSKPPLKAKSTKANNATQYSLPHSLLSHSQISSIENRKLKSSIEAHEFQSKIENREFKTRFEEQSDPYYVNKSEAYLIKKRNHQTRVGRLLKNQTSLQDFVVLREVIGVPKGLQ